MSMTEPRLPWMDLFSPDDATRHVAQEVLLVGAVSFLTGVIVKGWWEEHKDEVWEKIGRAGRIF